MATRVIRGQAKQVALSTTGVLLTLKQANGTRDFKRPTVLEISSVETSGEVQLETGNGLTDGGGVGDDARRIPVSSLPVELDVEGGPDIKLYADGSFNVTVVVR